MKYSWLLGLFLATSVTAHEMTPTYFEFKPSALADKVSETQIKLFNRREDVEYYEISVFDGEWKAIPFASENRLVRLDYLQTKRVSVYIRDQDLDKIVYICTLSKLKKDNVTSGAISSRICSKMKEK